MTIVLGCIAEDFTGATDLAGLLARSGVQVSLRIGVPKKRPEWTSPLEVIALKSRTASVDGAVFETREALMAELGVAQTIYCPAFPENGRSVDRGSSHVVADAASNEDPHTIATACRDMILLTGRLATLMPLPALYAADGQLPASAPRSTSVLSGSCSAMTSQQVAACLETGAPAFQLDPRSLAENGPGPALSWLDQQDLESSPLIYAKTTADDLRAAQALLGVTQAGKIVEAVLATCVVAARDHGARRIIVAGDETSGAVTQAFGADSLDIGWQVSGPDAEVENFGLMDFFSRAPQILETL